MKIFLKLFILLVLTGYLVFAFTHLNKSDSQVICLDTEIVVQDSTLAGFISKSEVKRLLTKTSLMPTNKRMDFIDTRKIENTLQQNPFIAKVQCYKTAGNTVKITVLQRLPFLRILSENGANYYIDRDGKRMDCLNYAANLVVVTGHLTSNYIRHHLLPIGLFLQENPFWNSQIEQLNVTKDGEIEMIPRVGDHVVHFGQPTEMLQKFNHLERFYTKVLPKVGWNKYHQLNLAFKNQIICTKN